MKKIQTLQLSVLAIYIIFLIFYSQSNTLNMRPYTTFSIADMSQSIQYPVFFIFAGLLTFLMAIRILSDEEYAKYYVTVSPHWQSRLWSKILGEERAIKLYKYMAPQGIVFSVALIVFGIVLFII